MRKHIRIEHQLKLHIESTEDRIEELEREQKPSASEGNSKEIKKLNREIETARNESESLRKDIK